MKQVYARIAGTGRCLPERVLTNADLEKMVETSDEWIRSRTGIERRHIVADDETNLDLCERAARKAMEMAGVGPARHRPRDRRDHQPRPGLPQHGLPAAARLGIQRPHGLQPRGRLHRASSTP